MSVTNSLRRRWRPISSAPNGTREIPMAPSFLLCAPHFQAARNEPLNLRASTSALGFTSSGARLARKPIPGTIASMVFADGGQAVATGSSNGVRLFSIIGDRSWKVDAIGPVTSKGEWRVLIRIPPPRVHVLG
jgi:hypothetical protein